MKGKVLSIITAILFGATMMACPIVGAATEPAAGTEAVKPAPKAKKKTTKKKKAPKAETKKAPKAAKKAPKKKAEPKTTM
jgi:hypothetical protein